jgi:hypothetical protein
MRAAEWINIGFFAFLIALAWLRPLRFDRRAKVTALGLGVIAIFSSAQFLERLVQPLPASVIRDWLPAPVFLVAYWTAGLFFTAPGERLQNRLIRLDNGILRRLEKFRFVGRTFSWIAAYFELTYLLCYPLLPFGLGVLYIAHMARHADEFWAIVLLSAYLCNAALPFVQTLPPRMLKNEEPLILPPTWVRRLNLWILRHGSIHVNTFPSAHVATAFSVSLVLLYLLPPAGAVFMWISVSIAIGVVLGRYHYAADAVLGASVAIAVFLAGRILF